MRPISAKEMRRFLLASVSVMTRMFRRKTDRTERAAARELYESITGRRYVYLLLCVIALAVSVVLDIVTGPSGMRLGQVIHTLMHPWLASDTSRAIIWAIRLPSAAMAIVVGFGLGIAGAEMQTVLNNPLASPFTLGVSSAAGFGAALAIVLGIGFSWLPPRALVPANAFLFALLCSLGVFWVARVSRASTETLVLAGIAMHFLFSSLLALLQYVATQEQLQAVVFWLFGDLNKADWPQVGIILAIVLLTLPLLIRDAWKLTALRLGDSKAQSLGVNVRGLRKRVLFVNALLTATATCFVGTIGFVGLVAPHIARMLVGEDQRFFVPLSALSGALLLSAASVLSKNIVTGGIFPVGIVTSFVGIPFFLSLILTKRRRHW